MMAGCNQPTFVITIPWFQQTNCIRNFLQDGKSYYSYEKKLDGLRQDTCQFCELEQHSELGVCWQSFSQLSHGEYGADRIR